MKFIAALCVLAVVSSVLGAPDVEIHDLMESPTREIDLMAHARQILEELVGHMRKSAQEALNAVDTFNAGMREEAKLIVEKMQDDMKKFRNRVTDAVDTVMNRVSNSSVAVRECVDSHRSAAAAIFNKTLSETMGCVNERIAEISKDITYLRSIASDALSDGSLAIEDMRKCTGEQNILAVGSCLGGVVMKAEMKSATFVTQSGVTIARIQVRIATMPATLQVCAGTQLVQAGIATGKIIVEIGGCSATGIFNNIVGKPHIE